jgi:ABC-2 type transport system ATP-binding protein
MLIVENLVKQYGDLTAVDDVSFEARPGTVFGLLGPNGAGKSTAINCISGLLSPTAGRIAVSGHDIVKHGKAAKQSLGVVPQELALYEDLPAADNLRYWGKAYGLRGKSLEDRVATVLEHIGLVDRAKDLPKGRSAVSCKAFRPCRSGARRGRLRALYDALHGRGGTAVRFSCDHRSRQDHRPGHGR